MSPTSSLFGVVVNGNSPHGRSTGLGFASINKSPGMSTLAPQSYLSITHSLYGGQCHITISLVAELPVSLLAQQVTKLPTTPISSHRIPHPPLSTSFLHPPARKPLHLDPLIGYC